MESKKNKARPRTPRTPQFQGIAPSPLYPGMSPRDMFNLPRTSAPNRRTKRKYSNNSNNSNNTINNKSLFESIRKTKQRINNLSNINIPAGQAVASNKVQSLRIKCEDLYKEIEHSYTIKLEDLLYKSEKEIEKDKEELQKKINKMNEDYEKKKVKYSEKLINLKNECDEYIDKLIKKDNLLFL